MIFLSTNTNENLNIVNIKLDSTLYSKVKLLAVILENKYGRKVPIYELMNEAMILIVEKYSSDIKEQLQLFDDIK